MQGARLAAVNRRGFKFLSVKWHDSLEMLTWLSTAIWLVSVVLRVVFFPDHISSPVLGTERRLHTMNAIFAVLIGNPIRG